MRTSTFIYIASPGSGSLDLHGHEESTVTNWHRAVSTIAIMVIDPDHSWLMELLGGIGAWPMISLAVTEVHAMNMN
jgi:hypothetical protein